MVISQFLISHGLPLGFALDFALNSTLFLFPLDFAFKKLFWIHRSFVLGFLWNYPWFRPKLYVTSIFP